ncbi:hypothetical protein TK34_16130 [Aeromonas hydrophila]|nr:hypothetical protein TK34_16130 [Aeromonas hydrophila]
MATLQEVKVNPLMADQLLLELSFSEPVSGFTDRLSYEPNQLLLHVPGAVGALNVNPLPIKQQGVDREFNFEVRHSPMPPDGTLRIP